MENSNFINLVHGINNSRVYKVDNELFCYTVGRLGIVPFVTKSIREMSKHLDEIINKDWGTVNLNFCYARGSLSKNKHKKVNKLISEQGLVEEQRLVRWIGLLL